MEEVLGNQTQTTKYIFPEFPKNLPGTFWGLTCFFNPQQYKNKKENYLKFRESNKKQGLKLICVELAFNDNPYELTNNDADILIQIRTASVLWQKERLLNIAFKSLPQDCDKIAWLDCDILFEDNSWIKLVSESLEKYVVVQPFKTAILLQQDLKKENGIISNSFVCRLSLNGFSSVFDLQRTGLVWCARREIFELYNFFDRAILGGGDKIMALSFASMLPKYIDSLPNKDISIFAEKWAKKIIPLVRNSVNYLPLTIIHLYHGEKEKRVYTKRNYILQKYRFNPETDIKINEEGVWVWNSNKKSLHRAVNDYFAYRDEEKNENREFNFLSKLIRGKKKGKLKILFFFEWVSPKNIIIRIYSFYIYMLGLVGKKLKNKYPEIYLDLKKYFPDK